LLAEHRKIGGHSLGNERHAGSTADASAAMVSCKENGDSIAPSAPKNGEDKTAPSGANLKKSQVLYRAAQGLRGIEVDPQHTYRHPRKQLAAHDTNSGQINIKRALKSTPSKS